MTVTCKFFTAAAEAEDRTLVSPEFKYANRPPWSSCVCPVMTRGAAVVRCGYELGQTECAAYQPDATTQRSVKIRLKSEGTQEIHLSGIRQDLGHAGFLVDVRSDHGRTQLTEELGEGDALEAFRFFAEAAKGVDWTSEVSADIEPEKTKVSYADLILGAVGA